MLLIHGVYHFWPKRVAFRDDYCLSCDGPRRAIARRTFDVGHIFWVPLIPVGIWKHWACTACRRDPHASPKTRRWLKWVGLICLVLLSAMFWATPIDASVSVLGWLLRVGPLVGAAVLLYQVLAFPLEPSLRARLAAIPPASDSVCPFCQTPLMAGSGVHWACPSCGAERW
jgi:hypothetical protein